MADKATNPAKASPSADEKLFTVPLRKEFLKTPKSKRAKRSVNTVRKFLARHMKVPETEVKISGKLNDQIWLRGAKKPPSKARIKAVFDAKEGKVFALLPDEKPPSKKDDKKAAKKDEEKKESVKAAVEKAVADKITDEAISEAVEKVKAETKPDTKSVKADTNPAEKPAKASAKPKSPAKKAPAKDAPKKSSAKKSK